MPRAHDSDEITHPSPFILPMHSGRKPHGSRTPYTASCVRMANAYAPRAWIMNTRRRSSQVWPAAPASIWVITSLSEEEVNPTPRCSRSRRNWGELVRLPLWPTPSGPSAVSIR